MNATHVASLLAVLVLASLPAAGATVVLNTDVGAPKLDAEQLELIYLGKKTLWESGKRIVPVLVEEESEASKEFLETVLKKSVSQYRAYWKRRLFSGGGTVPKTFGTTAEVVEYVSKTPGAIGLVEAGSKDGRVTVIQIAE